MIMGRARVVRLAEVTAEDEDGRCVKRVRRGDSTDGRVVRWENGRWLIVEVGGDTGGVGIDGGGRGGDEEGSAGRDGGDEAGCATDEATVDGGEGEDRRRGVWECEADIVEVAEARRGYTTAAAWDEGAMVQVMSRMSNPTLRWRYGDG